MRAPDGGAKQEESEYTAGPHKPTDISALMSRVDHASRIQVNHGSWVTPIETLTFEGMSSGLKDVETRSGSPKKMTPKPAVFQDWHVWSWPLGATSLRES